MLDEGEVAVGLRGAPILIAPERVAIAPRVVAPTLQREWRIGEHTVEGSDGLGTVTHNVLGIEEGVATSDRRVVDVVQEQVHLADRPRVQVLLLTEKRKALRVPSLPFEVVDRLQQHAAGAAGGVVD